MVSIKQWKGYLKLKMRKLILIIILVFNFKSYQNEYDPIDYQNLLYHWLKVQYEPGCKTCCFFLCAAFSKINFEMSVALQSSKDDLKLAIMQKLKQLNCFDGQNSLELYDSKNNVLPDQIDLAKYNLIVAKDI